MKCARIFVFIGSLLSPLTAAADVTRFSVLSMDCPSLANYGMNDIKIDFSGQYTGAQALVELTSGTIYQDSAGDFIPLSVEWIGMHPTVECDTFVGQGAPTSGGAHGDPSPGGGAIDLGGAAIAEFSMTRINQAWNPAGGVTIQNQNDFLIMRLTMSKDAQGTAKFLASAAGTPARVSWFVRNGVVTAVPEPASTALFGWTLTVCFGRRRQWRLSHAAIS